MGKTSGNKVREGSKAPNKNVKKKTTKVVIKKSNDDTLSDAKLAGIAVMAGAAGAVGIEFIKRVGPWAANKISSLLKSDTDKKEDEKKELLK